MATLAVGGPDTFADRSRLVVTGPLRRSPATEATPSVRADQDTADFADIVDEWGRQSFPASDPPANW